VWIMYPTGNDFLKNAMLYYGSILSQHGERKNDVLIVNLTGIINTEQGQS